MTTSAVTPGQQAHGREGHRPWAATVLITLLVFEGVGAVGGGAVMIADPSGRAMGWDTGMLHRAPFSSFLWPGIILGIGLGISALAFAFGVWRRPALRPLAPIERWTGHHWSWSGSIGLGIGLMAWIAIQLALVEFRSFLQPLMFTVGAGLCGVPLVTSVRRYLAAEFAMTAPSP